MLTINKKKEDEIVICILSDDLENLRSLIVDGQSSSLKHIREANQFFREMPLVVINALMSFCEAEKGKYDWMRIALRTEAFAFTLEADDIIYTAFYNWETNVLEWEPEQIII